MFSTMTLVLFFSPHSLTNVSLNQVSYPGTKCFHCRIFSVFCCALARPGMMILAPTPAARVTAPVIWSNCRRETGTVVPWSIGSSLLGLSQAESDGALPASARFDQSPALLGRGYFPLDNQPTASTYRNHQDTSGHPPERNEHRVIDQRHL